jgi:hypothetical protein
MSTSIIVHADASPLVLSEVVNDRIADGWQALQAKDSRVYNGTLLRVLGDVTPNSTSVSVAPDIGYREVVGLRSHKDFLNWVPSEEQFQVLSVIAFVETNDGAILLRDRSTGDFEPSIELMGGFITAKDVPDTIEEYISARVVSDLSLPLDSISSVERIGHVDFKSICESMFVCKVSLAVPFSDLVQDQIQFFAIPSGYTPQTHQSFFPLPLHGPSQTVLEQYLPRVIGA